MAYLNQTRIRSLNAEALMILDIIGPNGQAYFVKYIKSGSRKTIFLLRKGGFPVMAETTRNHIFSKEISQMIIAVMVLAPNFY